jgi:hypothetical protein
MPVPQRVGMSDDVFIGKVVRIEKKTIKLPDGPALQQLGGGAPVQLMNSFQVVVLKTEKELVGVKKGTEIRLAVLMQPKFLPNGRAVEQPILTFKAGQQVLLFTNKNPKEKVYRLLDKHSAVDSREARFAKELALTKKCAALLANPMKSLKAKDAKDRVLTAELLVSRYRTPKPGAKTEPIDSKESKLILETLSKADLSLSVFDMEIGLTPIASFHAIGATEKDGWNRPQDFNKLPEAARKWLKDNAGTYRIQRYVNETSEKAEDPKSKKEKSKSKR